MSGVLVVNTIEFFFRRIYTKIVPTGEKCFCSDHQYGRFTGMGVSCFNSSSPPPPPPETPDTQNHLILRLKEQRLLA